MKIHSTNFEGNWDETCAFCSKKQKDHRVELGELDGVRYVHRQPCIEEQQEIKKKWVLRARTTKAFIFAGWVAIPLIVTIVGFASPIIGLILVGISLFKIAWTSYELFGSPKDWIPGYISKIEKEQRMRHYYYHCEKNPEGFQQLMIENLKQEEQAGV